MILPAVLASIIALGSAATVELPTSVSRQTNDRVSSVFEGMPSMTSRANSREGNLGNAAPGTSSKASWASISRWEGLPSGTASSEGTASNLN